MRGFGGARVSGEVSYRGMSVLYVTGAERWGWRRFPSGYRHWRVEVEEVPERMSAREGADAGGGGVGVGDLELPRGWCGLWCGLWCWRERRQYRSTVGRGEVVRGRGCIPVQRMIPVPYPSIQLGCIWLPQLLLRPILAVRYARARECRESGTYHRCYC